MGLIEQFLGSFRPVEQVWCCERCRRAALAAAAERRGGEGTTLARARLRAALASTRSTRTPMSRHTNPPL